MTTVLVVDDEPQIVRTLRINLTARGDRGGEAGLDARPPRVIDVGVAGWCEDLQFFDQVCLAAMQFADFGSEYRLSGSGRGIDGFLLDGSSEQDLSAGAEVPSARTSSQLRRHPASPFPAITRNGSVDPG